MDEKKLKALSEIQRALGMLEGLSYTTDTQVADGIVDAVEVVRCKDCRFYRKPFCILNDNKNGWLNHELPEHFCSHGERETDG